MMSVTRPEPLPTPIKGNSAGSLRIVFSESHARASFRCLAFPYRVYNTTQPASFSDCADDEQVERCYTYECHEQYECHRFHGVPQYGTGSPCGTLYLSCATTVPTYPMYFHPASVQMIMYYSSLLNGVKNMMMPLIRAAPPTTASQPTSRSATSPAPTLGLYHPTARAASQCDVQ
jgi:hypothetical protein